MQEYQITAVVSRTYQGTVKASSEAEALDLVEESDEFPNAILGHGVELILSEVRKEARPSLTDIRHEKIIYHEGDVIDEDHLHP